MSSQPILEFSDDVQLLPAAVVRQQEDHESPFDLGAGFVSDSHQGHGRARASPSRDRTAASGVRPDDHIRSNRPADDADAGAKEQDMIPVRLGAPSRS
jgi:hypothetical protein